MNLEVRNYYEAKALWGVLVEAKFNDNPDNEYLQGSPLVSDLAERALEVMIQLGDESVEEWFANMVVTEQSILYPKVELKVKTLVSEKMTFEDLTQEIYEYLRPYSITSSTLKSIYDRS
jgi:hypothetical protein